MRTALSALACVLLTAPASAQGVKAPKPKAPKPSPSQKQIEGALGWLERHADPGGWWQADEWQKACKAPGKSMRGDSGERRYDVGVTSLAIMAFANAGAHHLQPGARGKLLKAALRFLLKNRQRDGSIGFGRREDIYNHVLATMAVARLFHVSQDPALIEVAEDALEWLASAQNPGYGWKYGPRTGRNDTSVTGWAVQALHALCEAGFAAPPQLAAGSLKWFERVTDRWNGVGYQTPGGGSSFLPRNKARYDPSNAMTLMGTQCKLLLGVRKARLSKSFKSIMKRLPSWKRVREVNFYAWYQGTRAFAVSPRGSKGKKWNKALREVLHAKQELAGCERGSWEPAGEWCSAGGRPYGVAINTLSLQAADSTLRPLSKVWKQRVLRRCGPVQVEVSLKRRIVLIGFRDATGKRLEAGRAKGSADLIFVPSRSSAKLTKGTLVFPRAKVGLELKTIKAILPKTKAWRTLRVVLKLSGLPLKAPKQQLKLTFYAP